MSKFRVTTDAESRSLRNQRYVAVIEAEDQEAAELEAKIRHAQKVGWRSTWVVSTEQIAEERVA